MIKAVVALGAFYLLFATAAGATSYPFPPDTPAGASLPATPGHGGVYQGGVFIAGPSYIDPQQGGWFYGDVGAVMGPYPSMPESSGSPIPGWDFTPGTSGSGGEDGDSLGQPVGGWNYSTGDPRGTSSQPDGSVPGTSGAGSGDQYAAGDDGGHHAASLLSDSDPGNVGPGTSDLLAIGGVGNTAGSKGGDGDVFGFDSGNSLLTLSATQLDPPPAAVPEPSSLALLGAGLLGFLSFRRRSAELA